MNTSTASPDRGFWRRSKWIWVIFALIVAIFLLNHHHQWYPWPWREASSPEKRKEKEVATKQVEEVRPVPSTGKQETPSAPASGVPREAMRQPEPSPSVSTSGEEVEAPGRVMSRAEPSAAAPGVPREAMRQPEPSPSVSASGKEVEAPGRVMSRAEPSSPGTGAPREAMRQPKPSSSVSGSGKEGEAPGRVMSRAEPSSQVLDYKKIREKSDRELKEVVEERKKHFGLDKTVDMVVRPEERIRVGDNVISVSEVLAQIKAQEESPPGSGAPSVAPAPASQPFVDPAPSGPGQASVKPGLPEPPRPRELPAYQPAKTPISYYAVYVVRPGDNLWDIHFDFLREYFQSKGIHLAPTADEPLGKRSSGVGRILKYAENMVHVFNLKTRKLSRDLDLLQPHERIVIFNLSALDKILAPLTKKKIRHVRFDGRRLTFSES